MAATAPAQAGQAPSLGDGEAALLPPTDDLVYLPGPLAGGGDGSTTGDSSSSSPVPDTYWRDTSDYMFGTVYVKTILLESNGSEEPESEDWDLSRKGDVHLEIEDALEYWEAEAPGELSFEGKRSSQTVETGVEPIRHRSYTGDDPCKNQWRWINDVMQEFGYVSNSNDCNDLYFVSTVYSAVQSYVHDLRNLLETEWAYVIFVVDSYNDGDGKFSDDKFAYAYRNGPFTVMTYDNNGWGIDEMNKVAAHEIGHIFGATDEYNGETESWGYLWEEDDDGSGCLMDTNDLSCISQGTQQQIGWRDSDGDGLEDPRETHPDVDALALDTPPSLTDDPTLPFSGTAQDVPFPAHPEFRDRGYHNISINGVEAVEWTVDGGGGSTSTDVADPFEAPWDFETDSLADGTYTVDVWSRNEVGGEDPLPVESTVEVDTTAPTAAITDPGQGAVVNGTISVNGTATDANLESYRVTVDGNTVCSGSSSKSDEVLCEWDTNQTAEGNHTLALTVVDELGHTSKDSVQVEVDHPIFVSLEHPAPGRVYVGGLVYHEKNGSGSDDPPEILGDVLYVRANVTAAVGTVDAVDFYVDGTHLRHDTREPYDAWIVLDPAFGGGTPGMHETTAVASTSSGDGVGATQPYLVPPS